MPRAKRTLVQLPPALLKEIDRAAGKRSRSAFMAEVMEREMRRRRLVKLLLDKEPIWKTEDHPEIGEDEEAYVKQMREEWSRRLERETR